MLKFGRFVAKNRVLILIIAVALLVPSLLGMAHTRINYDMLTYLPKNMDTVAGQDILMDDFGKGAFSLVVTEGMSDKDVAALKAKIEAVPHVDSVIWYDSFTSLAIPKEALPEKVYNFFNSGDATLMAVFFDTSTSADETIQAISDIRSVTNKQCYVSGLSALVTDLKALCEKEEPIYVTIAVLCACAAMVLFLDSWLVPFVFLASIGMAIVYNMGSNFFMGEISYITKAIAAILQLGVTMDYSIFLWHSYSDKKLALEKTEAMAQAIAETLPAVTGSSITTIAGFLALCFMSYTMGADLGIVMAKGVLLGVIASITTLPAMILIFDKPLEKTRHRAVVPQSKRFAGFVTRHYAAFLILFAVLMVPAIFGYRHTELYYDFTRILTTEEEQSIGSDDLQFLTANHKVSEDFNIACTHMIVCDADLPSKDAKEMIGRIEQVDGVQSVLGLDSLLGSGVPKEFLPTELVSKLESGGHQLILVNSSYNVSTSQSNDQIDAINAILKEYDSSGMLIGEAPCTKDLIDITDKDFKVVDAISIVSIFLIVAIVLKSFSLPVILVATIEFAVFVNLGIPYYTNFALPFLAPVCVSTIQLGSTVDYAILMTTQYRKNRSEGADKRTAITNALAYSIPSVLVSALGFFAATFGVGVYSDVSFISAMCNLLARGAIVSMLSVVFFLPALFMLLDKVIMKTSKGFRLKTPAAENAPAAETPGSAE